jgi:hypothetical protein
MLDHFPESEHAGLVNPVIEIFAGNHFHLRSTAPDEAKISIHFAQSAHQRRSVIVRARLARDEVDRHDDNDEARSTNAEGMTKHEARIG